MVQIDGVPFLDRSPPSSTAIEASRLLEGAPAPDPNEILSLHSSSVPSSQPSVSSIGQFYGHPDAIPPLTESSASWFGKHNNTPFIASDNYTVEPFDYPPLTSEEPIPETDSAFLRGPPSTIFTSDSYTEESIDYQMEYPMWALNEELSLSFPESDGILIDQHPITVPIIPVNPTVVFNEALVWKNTDPTLNKDLRNAIERLLKTSLWKRAFFLTKCIFAGSHWVGIANPFEASQVDQHEMLTNSLLAAIEVEGTTLEYLFSKPCECLPSLLIHYLIA